MTVSSRLSAHADVTLLWATRLMDGFAAAGVQRAVISPGARSTPLALAAFRHPRLKVQVVVDERSAAFFALGQAKATKTPTVLVATSGSAVANWLPAVVEADMARAPLILLSADRPPELHGCGANQTMDQLGLFSGHVRAFHQLPPAERENAWLGRLAAQCVAESLGPLAGPVHINIPLREPLVGGSGPVPPPARGEPPRWFPAHAQPGKAALAALSAFVSSGPGAIVCGPDDLGPGFRLAVGELALRLGAPIFADALSGLRFGPFGAETVLTHPDQVARTAPKASWILRFGGAPVSRATAEWLELSAGCPQAVIADHQRLADPFGAATHVISADPETLCGDLTGPPAEHAWLDRVLALDRAAADAAAQACRGDQAFEGSVLRALVQSLPEATPLFLGNSLTIRAAEWFAGRTRHSLRVYGNRGVSGIDGNISTAFGLAAAHGRAVAAVGDLAFLHDLNALAFGRDLPLVALVFDNGGGGIFDHLPQAGLPEFERGWLTPQALDPGKAAQAFGLASFDTGSVDEAVDAVLKALETPKTAVIRIRVDRATSLARCRAFHASCKQGH